MLFEASSIRKINGRYYFVYSSVRSHELCYAVSDRPDEGYRFGGTLVDIADIFLNGRKEEEPLNCLGNTHGGIECAAGQWYVFYHRQTNRTNYSRQGCAERIRFREDGSIPQVEMTSCAGLAPLPGRGEYPAYLACNLFCDTQCLYTGIPGERLDERFPKITQDGEDGDENAGYIENMKDGATAGFKYFDCKGIKADRD